LYSFFCDPLGVDVETLATELQLEVIEIQSSSALRAVFREKGLLDFYKLLDKEKYPAIVSNALKLVSVFGSSYICEQAFSITNLNKSKLRSRLTDDRLHAVMRVACSQLSPNIEQLSANMKCNVSH